MKQENQTDRKSKSNSPGARTDTGLKSRHAALQILKEVNRDGRYVNISLKDNLRSSSLDNRDAAFVTQLVYGTLEKQISIDHILGRLADLKRVNPWIMNILRLGAYQILYLDRVPDSAACNEAVKLCKAHGLFALQGFVNGILRNLSRSKEKLLLPEPGLSPADSLSLLYSYPLWLAEKWIRDYGLDTAEAIMKPMEAENTVSIRVNTMKTTSEKLKEALLGMGMEVQNGFHLSEALRISNAGDIEENRLYRDGWFTVQGESSMLDSIIVNPQPGEAILDACSSPGGKAVHMAQLMKGQGRIAAWDIHPHRVELIEANRIRMGAEIVEPSLADASVLNSSLTGKFDRVLIDATCSGLGVIHKKPDIKLRITADALKELPVLQAEILSVCSSYVKPGGVLVYSTCTINPDENEHIITEFLAGHPEYKPEDPSRLMPDTLHTALRQGMVQLIPSLHKTDGFFIARLRRSH